ncbi:PREDICTED: uncharacterized protein LOC104704706 [Camelina sativa]|uniref:Uncharacterized protein LOC104704706 n=1 Tax=Camelina sativa TaxID=90675 RepID=A0ABM0T0R2_CAMSA|nr:PREDICTED: uncharacterized protein LOC104704706 [Camelina sativa]
MDRVADHFDPIDVALIGAIPLSLTPQSDSLGWHFTKSGKYTVKSGYHTARMAVPTGVAPVVCGPDIASLKASVWKVKCPPKIQHFMWQVLSGCISVTANLRRRGIYCDLECARCGFPLETVNHALFECPPARQAWALSNVPTGTVGFPTASVFANVDHFLGAQNPGAQVVVFPWLMWYIWKARNARVYENEVEKPAEIARLAASESTALYAAQVDEEEGFTDQTRSEPRLVRAGVSLPNVYTGFRCFVDGSWKDTDKFAGVGWVCMSSQDSLPLMGASNFRRSLSPLHAEVEAFVWALRCMIGHDLRDVAFLTDCSDFVKMVSSPAEWPAFSTYLDDIKEDMEEFSSFSLTLIPRNANVLADRLARQVRTQPHVVTYVDCSSPNWLV